MPVASRTSEDAIFERRHRRKKNRGRAGFSLVGILVDEIERWFADRYGAELPDDDAGRDDLFVLLNHCAAYVEAVPQMRARAAAWAPWMHEDALEDMIADITARPLRWHADKLAARLGVDYATRTRLGFRAIGATDVDAAQRKAIRKERDRIAKQEKRRAAGVPPSRPRTETVTQRAPWRALGVSRRTWYRRHRGTAGTSASAA
jgi:hypothetical protein